MRRMVIGGLLVAALCALAVAGGGVATSPAIAPEASVMTGTIEERNAFIKKALDGGRIEQLSMQDTDVAAFLHLMSLQTKVDIRLDLDALKREGVKKFNVSLTLYNASLRETLETTAWLLRPAKGDVGFKLENGQLIVEPMASFIPAPENDAQKKRDEDLKAALAKEIKIGNGAGVSVDMLLYQLGILTKTSVVVDWTELENAGAKRETEVTLPADAITGEKVLQAALAAMKTKEGVAGQAAFDYRIIYGQIRVTTLARIRAEQVREKAATSMP